MALSQGLIQRESPATFRAPRLQKFRAVQLLFDAINDNPNSLVYVGLEIMEDVLLRVSGQDSGTEETYEQDKNYDPEASFSFVSDEILNTLCSFFDVWMTKSLSPNIKFTFYATNSTTKENNTQRMQDLGVTMSEDGFLISLVNGDIEKEHVLDGILKIFIDEYKRQYRKARKQGFTSTIDTLSSDEWKSFFNSIDWSFNSSDEEVTRAELIEKAKECIHYNEFLKGQEDAIVNYIAELVEGKAAFTDETMRYVSNVELENVYLKLNAETTSVKENDPVWEDWDDLPAPEDKRNISEKIIGVCAEYDSKSLGLIARKVAASKRVGNRGSISKDYKSLKYRVFLACEGRLIELLRNKPATLSNEIIDSWFNELKSIANDTIQDLKSDFNYSMSSSVIIEEVVYELFDSCFLAFDETNN